MKVSLGGRMAVLGMAAVFVLAGCAHVSRGTAGPEARASSVILFIGDGMGFNTVEAASLYKYGEPDRLVFQGFPVRLAASTYPADGIPYDPKLAWSEFEYVREGATDSAASGTALATGHKTRNGVVGLGPDGERLQNVRELAETLGRSTGVVTSVTFSHATPACFAAHNPSRGDYEGIAREMLVEGDAEVVMGCGHPWFDGDGVRRAQPGGFGSVGGPELYSRLVAGTLEVADCDGDGVPDPWTVVDSREGFQRLARGRTPKRVLGIAPVASTLQQGRSGDAKADAYQVPFVRSVPTLAEMTRAALNVLDEDPDGFFLMVEGGAIDWAAHANQPGRVIEETIDFERAVEAAVGWVEENSSWHKTLIIVTSDHETGHIWGPGSGPYWEPLHGRGLGRMPLFAFYSGGHTNSLVPVYAIGAGAALLEEKVRGFDPMWGRYVDNTDIACVIREAMGAVESAAVSR